MLIRILCTLALMSCAPAAATAQTAGDVGATAAVAGIYRAGQCVVQRDRALAIRLLEALPIDAEPQLQAAARMVRDAGCLVAPLPENFPLFLRGAIAQEMLSSDYSEFAGEPHSVARLINLRLPVESDQEPVNESARYYRWSDCVVRNDMTNVERLIRIPAGSDRERGLLRKMAPYFSACMGPQAQLSASAPEIRSLLMQSAYHMLYRYWLGQLRGAGLVNAENPDGRLICRTYESTGFRVKTERICMTPRDWERTRLTTRDEVAAFILRSTSRPY